MEEQKMETDVNGGIKNESVEMNTIIKVEQAEPKEEKMHVDDNNAEFKEYVKVLTMGSKPVGNGSFELVVQGISDDDDIDDDEEDENIAPMRTQDMVLYLKQQVAKDAKISYGNPFLELQKHNEDLSEEADGKVTEVARLDRALNRVLKNQEKFLRAKEILPKVPTNNMAINVDLPLILDYEAVTAPEKVVSRKEGDCLVKEDPLDTKVLAPAAANTKPSGPQPSSAVSTSNTISVTSALNTSSTASISSAGSIAFSVPNATSKSSIPSSSTIAFSVPSASAISSNPSASSTPVPSSATAIKVQPKPSSDIECIDLTDDTPIAPPKPVINPPTAVLSLVKHPAPLPPKPFCTPNSGLPNVPPKPRLKIYSEERGIVLEWDMPPNYSQMTAYGKLNAFDIFGYQEQKDIVINTLLWKKIGSVKAMNLPMACTLTQFVEGQKYHFSVRAVDVHNRCGAYSDPISIVFKPHKTKKT